jgi:hypothetical protein
MSTLVFETTKRATRHDFWQRSWCVFASVSLSSVVCK